MTKEEFWRKWNPCDYSEWGHNGETIEGTKQEMFKDLDKVANEKHFFTTEPMGDFFGENKD